MLVCSRSITTSKSLLRLLLVGELVALKMVATEEEEVAVAVVGGAPMQQPPLKRLSWKMRQ